MLTNAEQCEEGTCDGGGHRYLTLEDIFRFPMLWWYRATLPWNFAVYGLSLLVTFIGLLQWIKFHAGLSQLRDLTARESTLLRGSRLNGDLKDLSDVRELLAEDGIEAPLKISSNAMIQARWPSKVTTEYVQLMF